MRVRDTCRHCGRTVTQHSRLGIYWRCPDCRELNPGPAMVASLAKPPDPRRRRRVREKELRADPVAPGPEQLEPTGAATGIEAAPVRRARTSGPETGSAAAEEAPGTGDGERRAPEPEPAPTPRQSPSFFDRVMYGGAG